MRVSDYLLLFPMTVFLAQAQEIDVKQENINTPIQMIKEKDVEIQDLSKLPLAAWATEAVQNKARQGDAEACILMSQYWQHNTDDEVVMLDEENGVIIEGGAPRLDASVLSAFLDGKERSKPLVNDSAQWSRYWLEKAYATNAPIAKLYQIILEIDGIEDNPKLDALLIKGEEIAIPLALQGHPRALEFLFFKGSARKADCMKALKKGLQLLKEDSIKNKQSAAADYYTLIAAFSAEGAHLEDKKKQMVKGLLPDAIKYLRDAASKDDPSAIYILCDAINVEEISSESPQEYLDLLKKGSVLNDVRVIHQLSMMTNEEATTKECYTRLVALGDARSLAYEAAALIAKGEGMKALPLLERALVFGEAYVMELLSNLYEGNAGVPANPEKAFELAQKMVEQHSVLGMIRLARFYEKGLACNPDPAKAHELLQWASLSDLPASHVALARSYLLGIGCTKDEQKAYNFLSALYKSNPEIFGVTFLLGYCNEEGLGTKLDLPQAMQFYQEGVKIEDPKAMNNLATMYKIGSVGKPDMQEAERLYTLAAKLGNTDAKKNIEAFSSKAPLIE